MGNKDVVGVDYSPTVGTWGIRKLNGRPPQGRRPIRFGNSYPWPWSSVNSPSAAADSILYKMKARNEGGSLSLGPVIGILASDYKTRFRGDSKNFRDIILTGYSLGALVYVFTTDAWDHAKRKLEAFTVHPVTKKWIKGTFPLPNVVYNRIPYREHEQRPEVRNLLTDLKTKPDISLFNPQFFNKGELYEWLQRADEVIEYLPETKRLNQLDDLKDMVQRHGTVYLKPVDGKAGAGIMRIVRTDDGYLVSKQGLKGSKNMAFPTLAGAWASMQRALSASAYLVQQGVPLAKVKDRFFDLRALLQKNGNGEWGLTGLGARVAGTESITTHVPRGGRIGRPEALLRQEFGSTKTRSILMQVEQAAIRIAEAIEKHGIRPLGEMSMDVAIDQDGAVWFLEANSKPMKFDEPKIRKKSLVRLIEYSSYLAGFTGGR